MIMEKVANGVFWVEIPEADLRILCGCPADTVKHLIKRGLVAPVTRAGITFETGPNAILLSDTPIQKGSFANLSEFVLLQMFYRQGMIIPGHPGNTGRKPLLIGLGDQVRSQAAYVLRGNYGLISEEEIMACGVSAAEAREMMAVKKWFSFGSIKDTAELVDARALDADAVTLAPGVVVHRKGFNRYEFLHSGHSVEVNLTLEPGEEYAPPYLLPVRPVSRERFSVVHVGEGDGWDVERPCMGSMLCVDGRFYLVDAGPSITKSLESLGVGLADLRGIFQSHAHDDHFSGLTSLVRSERRLAYYAVPWVRASVQKKLSALMRIDESRFHRFFDVHDLVPGVWNAVGGFEVKPVYSPHPVETTIFFFRAGQGTGRRVYGHLADMPSFEVLDKLAAPGKNGPALSARSREAFLKTVSEPVDLKKVDVGGGLIHGNAADFAHDGSTRLLLSHGIRVLTGADAVGRIASFGDIDVLIPGPVRAVADASPAAAPSGIGAAMDALDRCLLFADVRTDSIRRAVAAAMEKRILPKGGAVLPGRAAELLVLSSGEVDIVIGAQLIETVEPGGFWGEERVASEAPSLYTTHAEVDSTCWAIPGAALADIPIVQWGLLETFERRLRSFRAVFRFEWSESFCVGVAELDEQHKTLFALVNSLSEAIGRSGAIEGHDALKREVLDFTRKHFLTEESYMENNAYPRLSVQRGEHAELLERLETFTAADERRTRPRLETAVDYLKDWLIKHTLIEDLQYREFFAARGVS
jgi:hemerythrin-like metal-binding protein